MKTLIILSSIKLGVTLFILTIDYRLFLHYFNIISDYIKGYYTKLLRT